MIFTRLVGEERSNLPLTPPMPSEEENEGSIPLQSSLLASYKKQWLSRLVPERNSALSYRKHNTIAISSIVEAQLRPIDRYLRWEEEGSLLY